MGSSCWKISTKPPSSEGSFFINIGICSYNASHPSPIISNHFLALRGVSLLGVVVPIRVILVFVFWVVDGLVALQVVLVLYRVDDVIRDGPGRTVSPQQYLNFRPRIYS